MTTPSAILSAPYKIFFLSSSPCISPSVLFYYFISQSSVAVNCIPVLKSNIAASNGLVHIIDGVLSPIQRNLKELMATRQDLSMFREGKTKFQNDWLDRIIIMAIPTYFQCSIL